MAEHPASVDLAAALTLAPTTAADWLIVLPLVLPLVGGAVALALRAHPALQRLIGVGVLGLLVVVDVALLARVARDGAATMVMGRWLPPFGIAFTADMLGVVLALASAVAALLAAVYALSDTSARELRFGFTPFLLLLVAGCTGAFLTGDLFNLYVWFEVLLISSFGLAVLGGEPRQLDGAVKYGLLNLVATTLFLIATAYLYGLVGTLNMADIAAAVAALPPGTPIATIAALFLLAFGMKAAAFPVAFWLPASYHTPRIVVGAVFAGLLTKVGVYALVRTLVMLMPAEGLALSDVVGWSAGLTIVVAGLAALGETEIRRILGYLVISGIGAMLAGLAIGTAPALAGTVVYAVHSILAMTAVYLAVGVMERVGGTSRLDQAGGLYGASPLLALLFFALMLAVSGLPPFSGFWPKVMIVRAALETGAGWLAAAVLLSGFLSTVALGRVWLLAFWRPAPAGSALAGGGAPVAAGGLVAPVAAFALIALVLGLAPDALVRFADTAAAGLLDPGGYRHSVFPAEPAAETP